MVHPAGVESEILGEGLIKRHGKTTPHCPAVTLLPSRFATVPSRRAGPFPSSRTTFVNVPASRPDGIGSEAFQRIGKRLLDYFWDYILTSARHVRENLLNSRGKVVHPAGLEPATL